MPGMYSNGVQEIMAGNVDLINDNVAAVLVDTGLYTVDLATQTSLADIPQAAILSDIVLTGNTLDGVIFRADDTTFNSVLGAQCGAVVVYKDTGEYSTSTLLAYLDDAAQFPITPDGEDITVKWENTPTDGIFKL